MKRPRTWLATAVIVVGVVAILAQAVFRMRRAVTPAAPPPSASR